MKMPDKFPKISVITPSYNQAEFLERTICSVLDQNYPNLEYIVIDGGSTDGSVDIIRRYADRISYWVSEPDSGQSNAINKGLKMATGEWVGWQNSDDIYYPGAFDDLSRAASVQSNVDLVIGNINLIDQYDGVLRDIHYVKPSYGALLAEGMVLTNQAAFWRRGVHQEIGWLNESLHYSFDYEWFLRLTENRKGTSVNKIWGGYRLHDATKTSTQNQRFVAEKADILRGCTMPNWKKSMYKLRRVTLMILQGDFAYFARGVFRLLTGKGGTLY